MKPALSPLAAKCEHGHQYFQLDVTKLVSGMDLRLGLHLVTGQKDGPTLGIITTVHGDETIGLMAVRELINSLDVKSLAGRVAVIPVANPLAVAVFNRQTPEQHGNTDLHEVFPGSPNGNITQRIAHVITRNLLDHVDAFIDMHTGGMGGRLQWRADLDASARPEVYEASLKLCRAFNAPFVHSNNLAGNASHYCNQRGIPSAKPEIGGVYLGRGADETYIAEASMGLRSIMAQLEMIEQPAQPPKKQLLFGVKSRFEVNPSVGGFLRSTFDQTSDLGRRIEKGTKLGEIIDIHSLEVAEELKASVTGYLFFSRYSGVVDAGTKAFALAEEETSQWL